MEMMATTEMVGEIETEMAGEMEMETVGEMETEMNEAIGMEILIGMIKVICLSPIQELTMLCNKMVLEEEDRVEKFIGGLPDNIQGIQDVVWTANNLMDQKLKGYAMRNAENKRRLDNN
ncbi:hypothetical protein Tco_1266190 [Tanacetum coccineum]